MVQHTCFIPARLGLLSSLFGTQQAVMMAATSTTMTMYSYPGMDKNEIE